VGGRGWRRGERKRGRRREGLKKNIFNFRKDESNKISGFKNRLNSLPLNKM